MTIPGARSVRRAVDVRICREVLAVLELATSGGRKLDVLVACALGDADIGSEAVLHALLDADALPRHADLLGIGDCPRYTTSLDAVLPGEHVVLSVFAPAHGHWSAVQRSVDGHETVGHGATEVLARRVAALKSLAGEARIADGSTSAPSRPAAEIATRHPAHGRAAANDAAGQGDEEPDPAEVRRILRALARGTDVTIKGVRDNGDRAADAEPESETHPPNGERDWQIRF